MARRPYAYLAGNLSGWPTGTVPTPPILRNLDQYSSELVDGAAGGEWAPVDPIVVGQSINGGVEIASTSANGGQSGDIETVKGNTDANVSTSPAGLVLLDGARPSFQTARTRNVVVPFGFFQEVGADYFALQGAEPHTIDPTTFGAKTVDLYSTTPSILQVSLPFRAQHRGATIVQVDFRFVVAGPRTALPTTAMPKFRVARCSSTTIDPLHSNVAPYDVNGWYVDQAADAPTYYNNGETRTVSYLPDQNNTALDPSTYAYVAQITDESPMKGGYGNLWLSATVWLTSIADMGEEF